MSLARDVIGGRGSGTRKSGIFISYRRSQEDNARRLHALLSTRFGEDRVFRDYASITPGEDYHNRIMNEVSKCGVMLALIGPEWLGATGIPRRRQINKPGDWVRREIEKALETMTWIIPVLVDEAKMPREDDLPQSIRYLASRQGYVLSPDGFDREVGRLIHAIEKGYEVPQEEWRLDLQSSEGSSSTFRLWSDNREHLITISFTKLRKSAIYVDGQEAATEFTAGITSNKIPLAALGSVFGSAATIMVETLNWATVVLESTIARYRIILEIDDQILKYESEEYSRAREKRNRNQLRREQVMKQASDSVKDFLESDSFKEALRGASRDLAKDERVKEAVKSGSRAVVDALKRHKWR